jgi:ATP-dependent DNA helicase RecG
MAMSTSSFATVDSPPTGGCSPPSSGSPPGSGSPLSGDRQRGFAGAPAPSRDSLLAAPLRWPAPSRLDEPLKAKGKLAEALKTLELHTLGDLLEHLPRAHREARTIAQLRQGEQATVAVEVRSIAARPVRRRGMRPLVEASVFDESGTMRATFFNQPWLVERYPPGTRLILHGKADGGRRFKVSHHAPGSDVGAAPDATASETGARPAERPSAVAHYPASEGVSSTQIMTLVVGAKQRLADVPEPLPGLLRARAKLPDRRGALAAMHFPRDPDDLEAGRRRLAFEELLLAQLLFGVRRRKRGLARGAPVLSGPATLTERWLENELPFQPTSEQSQAMKTIAQDLAQPVPMQRLLMGEVGSGKTVVALYAMLRAVEQDRQAALMAPTETLAEQHFSTVQKLLGSESLRCELLTGSTPARRRRELLGRLKSGELSLVVGTHALIEPDVTFAELAVTVIDEQHRFGVRQRAALDAKGTPHTLHMTATPIPRTLQLCRYGDLDTTLLRELPKGRQPIATRIVAGEAERGEAYEEMRRQLSEGRQAYVVCPLVDQAEEGQGGELAGASAAADAKAAKAEFERLRAGELAGFRLALLHGQMGLREKQQAMEQFASGEAQALVATTVIEVGVDVPNATVMLVENAERFGISQLHQLRGRVGRGQHPSTCLLVGSPSSGRLQALGKHSDGFKLAEIDLAMRKEGELVGTRQSGMGQFRVASLPEDAQLLERARACAKAILAGDPELRAPEHALLADALERSFGEQAAQPLAA